MRIQHQELAGGRWQELSFFEQMANIGSEVERAIKWRQKNQLDLSQKAVVRALELLSLTISSQLSHDSRLRELLRVKECLLDTFLANNEYGSSDKSWQSYFRVFTYAASVKVGR